MRQNSNSVDCQIVSFRLNTLKGASKPVVVDFLRLSTLRDIATAFVGVPPDSHPSFMPLSIALRNPTAEDFRAFF